MSRTSLGAVAGFAATAPMTAVMLALYRRLPRRQKYPLPPVDVTRRTLNKAGLPYRRSAMWLGHFGYGAAAGAALALVRQPRSAAEGALWGAALWAGSYLGWLPALELGPDAREEPMKRNLLMLAAHLVWGAAAGALISLRPVPSETRRGSTGRRS